MAKKIVFDLDPKDKAVLVRTDSNIPSKGGEITDDNRITQALPTIQYIVKQGGKIVLFSHLGKVEEESDKVKLTLRSVAKDLSKRLDKRVVFVPETRSEKLETAIKDLKEGDVLLVEDTCYEDLDGKKEFKNDPELGKYWASLGDVFVNDAFGTARHEHASNVSISTHLETAAGFLVDKEVKFIGGAVNDPYRPVVAILGGARVSDKISVIKNLINIADKIIISGSMAYTFLKAQGKEIDISLLEEDKTDFTKDLLGKHGGKIILPVDAEAAKEFSNNAEITVVPSDSIPADQGGMDIGSDTVKLFAGELEGMYTVIWNRPVGVSGFNNFTQGAIGVRRAIANPKDATAIIGGGDSAATAIPLGFENDFTRILTGDGTSLECLEGKELPGIKAINNK